MEVGIEVGILTLKNHKDRMTYVESNDSWISFDNNSNLLEMRCMFIGERTFVRMLTYEQEFPSYADNSTDTKENPPKWTRLDQFEIREDEEHVKYLVRVTNTELCNALAKYQRKLRKELEQ